MAPHTELLRQHVGSENLLVAVDVAAQITSWTIRIIQL